MNRVRVSELIRAVTPVQPARRVAVGLLTVMLALGLTGCGRAQPTPTPLPTDTPVPTATPTPAPTDTPASASDASPAPATTSDATPDAAPVPPPQRYGYRVLNSYPHDVNAFTQGLVYQDDIFYEGTGLRGNSTLRKVDPETGEVLAGVRLPDEFFGEGVAVLDDKVYQLTWQANTGFIFDKADFQLLDQFSYPTEGWGLTHDDARLIMSDGTSTLYFLDPETLDPMGSVDVRDDQGPVVRLNELEYIDGLVYANVWQTDRIAQINPENGQVVGWIDLSGLLTEDDFAEMNAQLNPNNDPNTENWIRSGGVLNGIAYDAENDRLFVTGKLWPKLVEIELVPANE